jgi:putative oxidoreductase
MRTAAGTATGRRPTFDLTRARDVYAQVHATRDAGPARDLALLGARIGLAWIFIYNGGGKLFGLFGGGGVHQASLFFAQVAHLHPAEFFTVVAGITEFFGGVAVGLGIFGRIAAIGLVVDMIVAMATVTWGNGIVSNAPGGGYQLNVVLITLALVVAFLGTGRFSLDVLIRTVWERGSASKHRAMNTGGPGEASTG